MKQSHSQSLKLSVVLFLTFALFFSTIVSPPVSAQSRLTPPAAHVSDTAGAVPEAARQQLENILGNLKQRSGVNFFVLTVQTTGGVEIFDYAAKVARDWDVASRSSAGKSLLLVVAIDEKSSIILFSRSVQRDLPEGALADTNEQMRGPVSAGHVAEALLLGVQKMVSALSGRLGFSTEGLDQPPKADVAQSTPETVAGTADTTASARPTPRPVEESQPAATQPTDDPKASSTPATREPSNKKKDSTAEGPKSSSSRSTKKDAPVDDAAEAEEVEVMLADPLATRIDKLKNFIATHPESKSKSRAAELLIVARAALGDEKLKAGDTAAGVDLLFAALGDAPAEMSDNLYYGVISRIPLNLYVRGENAAAFKAARQLETKVAGNAKRLLALSGFYLEIELGDEAVRVAEQAVKLAPEMAEAHNALGLALHVSLRLEEAATEYKRALDLDPKTRGARRALADLNRSAGRFDEALALYREQLAAEKDDKQARVGAVLSLFELGKIDEAKSELNSALEDDPRNLILLTGAAYWLVAHGESTLALALAQRAVRIEPRYTWAQIALSRSLVAQKQPLDSERCIRFARQYGKFPTLDYELASTLAALGLYEEASQALVHSFTLKDGQIETQLANRIPARAATFPELLTLERRASIFQATAADTEDNARILKTLLAFTSTMNTHGADGKVDEAAATAAAREFAAGKDDMRAYRQLYAASRLLQRGIAFQTVQELSDSARDAVDAAIFHPAVTVAVQADELADIRARAIASGGTPNIPDAPRNVLANILRGRIEALSGWALFNLDKTTEAIDHLRRATGILPVGTPLWQTAGWHLGVALQQTGKDAEALTAYIKSYSAGVPDGARRSVIEQLYKKINGSLEGLDDRIGPAALVTSNVAAPSMTPTPAPDSNNRTNPEKAGAPLAEPVPTPAPTPTPEPAVAQPSPSPEATPTPDATSTPTPEPARSPEPVPTPTPESTKPQSTPTPEASPAQPSATPVPTPESTPAETATPSPSPTPASGGRPRRVKPPG